MSSQTMACKLAGSLRRITAAKTDEAFARVVDRECRSLGVTPEELHDVIGYLVESGQKESRRPVPGELERRSFTGTWKVQQPAEPVVVRKNLTLGEARKLMQP